MVVWIGARSEIEKGMRCLLQACHRGSYLGVRSAGGSWSTSGSSSIRAAGIPHRVPCRAMGSMVPSQQNARRTIRWAQRNFSEGGLVRHPHYIALSCVSTSTLQ